MDLRLIGGFSLVLSGTNVQLPRSAERVVAFLAIAGRPTSRSHVAGSLWPDSSEEHASGSLRSLLWRLSQLCDSQLVNASSSTINLSPDVKVDYQSAMADASSLLRSDGSAEQFDSADASHALLRFSDDLVPDWYDEWVQPHRERFHELRLQALETLSEHWLEEGQLRLALEAAATAVAGEPLRESPHRQVIRILLRQGNEGGAVREYLQFQRMLETELGLKPTKAMTTLLDGVGSLAYESITPERRSP